MRHVPASVVTLRPLDELERQPAPAASGPGRTALRAPGGPRSVLEMLDLALEVLRDRFGLMVGLATLAWLPVRALQPFLGAHVWESSLASGASLGPSLSLVVNSGATALAQCFGSALLARLVYDGLVGREFALGPALRFVLLRFHVVLGIAFVTAIASAAGMCACILPWLLVAWKFSMAPMICVIEGTGVGASLQRSFLLTRRGFWRWLFLTLCASALSGPFTLIAVFADLPDMRGRALAFSGLSSASFDALLVLVSSLVLGVTIALHAALLTVYYADARLRREGADLEADLARLAAGGAAR